MKKIKYSPAFLLSILFLFPALSFADQWQIVGPRALGMGGAHVAVVNDATAQYWNPAAFGFFGRQAGEASNVDEHSNKDFGMHIHGGLGYQSHNDTMKEIDDIADFNYDAIQADIDGTDGTAVGLDNVNNIDEYIKLIDELDDLTKENMGATALVDASLNMRIRNWGVGVIGTLDLSAVPVMDMVNINTETGGVDMTAELGGNITPNNTSLEVLTAAEFAQLESEISALGQWSAAEAQNMLYLLDDALNNEGYTEVPPEYLQATLDVAKLADQSVNGGSFENNSSILEFRGASITEVPVTYGHAFSDNFSIGGNVKWMKAETYYYRAKIFNSDSEDHFDNATDNAEKSSSVGVDLGALYKAGPVRLGLVARNVNKPSFDYAGPGDYEIDPQVRAGMAVRMGWLTIAADLDLTENDTNVSESYKSKNFAFGAEFDLLRFLRLRAGAYKNLSESDIGTVYTAGLGLNFYAFQLDAGVAWSEDKAEIEGDDVREEARGELALSFQF